MLLLQEDLTGDRVVRDMELPEDPERWDAEQLAGYLAVRLRGVGEAGEGEEVVAFVRERGIGGRVFLGFGEREVAM